MECLLMLDAATMQLHWLRVATLEAARIAGLPWSTPRDATFSNHLINSVNQRRSARGVPNSETFNISNPSPN
eukprot:11191485-Lingulodinium_polyedra.AAC.1